MTKEILSRLINKGGLVLDNLENLYRLLDSSDETHNELAKKFVEAFVFERKNFYRLARAIVDIEIQDIKKYLTKNDKFLDVLREVKQKRKNRQKNKPYRAEALRYMHPISRSTWLRNLAEKLKCISIHKEAYLFTTYTDKLYHTHDIDKFRFWKRNYCGGGSYFEFTFNFYEYEFEYSHNEGGILFTRKCDRQENECVCFIAFLGDVSWRYGEEAKLKKGIYNRETKEFLPKNINYIKKRLNKQNP